ncbi:YitT family protein [Bacillus infantis]|uniref:YczE/YyaS/YitT family protein n=1 Tax=Bacillus infantis TaxID=324767 RepID=UPI001CD73A5F|nr:YitT family protein [Bacillus infantis]MCA1039001.1 YitT family protein [Bacillus infantis]MCR6612113.1 YitT family protein [Bacillus infantis]
MIRNRKGQTWPRFAVFFSGLLIMALGIVLLIKAELGATPWDVLHVGLFYQAGLTIGSWSIIVGLVILTAAALLSGEIPQFGAFLNMLLIGVFIDFYMMLPFMQTPGSLAGKIVMLGAGIIINAYGMGLYISAQFGAGPRDSLMIALAAKTGWKIRDVRGAMELLVLAAGWLLGGPIFWATILYTLVIGPLAGLALPQCQTLTDKWLEKLRSKKGGIGAPSLKEQDRGASS